MQKTTMKSLFKSIKVIFIIELIIFSLIFNMGTTFAHSPHDVIRSLEISPSYDQDNTLFVIIHGKFLMSTDGGFSWKQIVRGIDNKFLLSSIAISPSFNFDKTSFISSNGDGIYKSTDGGSSWFKTNDGLGNLSIRLLAISPNYHQDKIVFAAGTETGLYKSKDGGESWYQVIDNSIKVSAIAFFSGQNKDHFLVGDNKGFLYLYTNSGETWQQHFQIPNCGGITSIAISPNVSSDNTYLIGTEKRGVFRTVDGGASYIPVNIDLSEHSSAKKGYKPSVQYITSITISPNYGNDSTIFVTTWYEAVFRSSDGGETWEKYSTGITTTQQADEPRFKSPHFMDLRISKAFKKDKTIFLGGFDGLSKSTDGGNTWKQMETLSLKPITGLSLSPEYSKDSTIAIATFAGGSYITHNKGIDWEVINSGLHETQLWAIDFSPNFSSDNTIFTISNHALYKSTNRGTNWDRIELGHQNRIKYIVSRLYTKLFGRWFGKPKILKEKTPFPTKIAISPNFSNDNTIYLGTRYQGVLKSVDGGVNWSRIWRANGLFVYPVISPDFKTDRTLYATVFSEGIYKTIDGGDTWQLSFDGRDPENPTYFSLAISPNYKKDKTVFVGSNKGLFKTINGGESWQKLDGWVYGKKGSIGLKAISPYYKNDRTLIVSVKGRGLFKTIDGGSTFTEIGHDLINNNHSLRLIKFSPAYSIDHNIYGAGEELFQSKDDGNTWAVIKRPIRYEDKKRDVISYQGEWERKSNNFSAKSVTHSNVALSKAIFNFVGSGVSWIGTESNDQGIAKVFIDEDFKGYVDQFSDTRNVMVNQYSITNLDYGPHTIMIEVSETKNPKSIGYRIEIDAFDIEP